MKVNVICSKEYELEIDDKFNVMDLPEDDDGWDDISPELEQELVSTVHKTILTCNLVSTTREAAPACNPVNTLQIEEIYNPEGETLYRKGWI